MLDTLLIIEDEKLLGRELARHFQRQGWDVVLSTNLAEAGDLLFNQLLEPLVVLSDMTLPDGNALDLLEKVRSLNQGGEWLFLTGYGSVADSVRALRLGAYDFVEKPCSLERLDMLLEGASRSARAQRRIDDASNQEHSRYTVDAFLGTSRAATDLRAMLRQLAGVPLSSLVLTGETGTGKGLVARIIHYSGTRAAGPIIEQNCAAVPRDLMESQLFGYEPGAFTGARGRHRGLMEQAHKGTLFLDEIAELHPDLQSKLLKVVEEQRLRRLGSEKEIQVDVQIVAATNYDLLERVKAGLFRSDLYHRLSVFHLRLPSLHERLEDLRELVPQFVEEYNAKAGKKVRVIPDEVWNELYSYDWPGNVRELRNAIERCVLLSNGSEVFPEQWLQLPKKTARGGTPPTSQGGEGIFLPLDGSLTLEEMERYILKDVLDRTHYNVAAAARMLGTTRETLRYRVQKFNLKVDG